MKINYRIEKINNNISYRYSEVKLYNGNIKWENGKNVFSHFPNFEVNELSEDYIYVLDTKKYYEKKLVLDSDGCDFKIKFDENILLDLEVFYNWISFTNYNNEYTFHCDKNFLLNERDNKIVIFDKNNKNNFIIIHIVQDKKHFTVECDPKKLILKSFIAPDHNNKINAEVKVINVSCIDGCKDFYVLPILEYINTDERIYNVDSDPETMAPKNNDKKYIFFNNKIYELNCYRHNEDIIYYYKKVDDNIFIIKDNYVFKLDTYDEAIKIKKIDNSKLEIINFGKVMNIKSTSILYKVILQHMNNVFSREIITITYN